MDKASFILNCERDSHALGEALADALCVGDVVLLRGSLGAGKTTLARAVIQKRCGVADIPSPTFTLVETYAGEDLTIWHFDLYRLKSPDEAWELGVEEAFAEGASLIEWPERAPAMAPATALEIVLSFVNGRRIATINAPPAWRERLHAIAGRMENQLKNSS